MAEQAKKKTDKHYLVTAKDPFLNHTIKFARFIDGKAVFNLRALAEQKPHWITHDPETGEFTAKDGKALLLPYVDYYKKRGFKVEEITKARADKLIEDQQALIAKRINDQDAAAQKAAKAKKDGELGPRIVDMKAAKDKKAEEPAKEEEPVEVTFICDKCGNEWDAVDLGITDLLVCPECEEKAGHLKADKPKGE